MTQPNLTYIICATPRSGSTLLCEALKNTGLAGNPDEFFGPMHVKRWSKLWQPTSAKGYLENVFIQGTSANGVLGIKVMRLYWQNFIHHLQEASGNYNLSDSELLETCFPNLHYIWITRRDKVRQAVSWLKFLQGSAWYWEADQPQRIEGLVYKPETISEFIQQTSIHESAWMLFFQQAKIKPYIVVYEDLVLAYEETAIGILKFLAITYPKDLVFAPRRIKKQADGLSDEWVQRYLSLYRDTEKM